VRINAIRSLGTFGPSARDAILPLATDTDANVRITVAQSVGTVLDSAAADWDGLWKSDTGLTFRASLLASAAQGRDARHVLHLGGPWAKDGDWRHLAAYGAALSASSRGPRRDRALEELRGSPDPRVRARLLAALRGPERWTPFAPDIARMFKLAPHDARDALRRIDDTSAWETGLWPGSAL
jgi:hypothetical protein